MVGREVLAEVQSRVGPSVGHVARVGRQWADPVGQVAEGRGWYVGVVGRPMGAQRARELVGWGAVGCFRVQWIPVDQRLGRQWPLLLRSRSWVPRRWQGAASEPLFRQVEGHEVGRPPWELPTAGPGLGGLLHPPAHRGALLVRQG